MFTLLPDLGFTTPDKPVVGIKITMCDYAMQAKVSVGDSMIVIRVGESGFSPAREQSCLEAGNKVMIFSTVMLCPRRRDYSCNP